MGYFKKVKEGDKVLGFVFGPGKVTKVYDKESHFRFEVEFKNNYQVPYTEEGIPGWGSFSEQTLFYKNDIDLETFDHEGVIKILSLKKIIKLRDKQKLEVKTPSGIWHDISQCNEDYVENILENKLFFLLRQKK